MQRSLCECAAVALADLPKPSQPGTQIEVGGAWIVLPLLGKHWARTNKAHVPNKYVQ